MNELGCLFVQLIDFSNWISLELAEHWTLFDQARAVCVLKDKQIETERPGGQSKPVWSVGHLCLVLLEEVYLKKSIKRPANSILRS